MSDNWWNKAEEIVDTATEGVQNWWSVETPFKKQEEAESIAKEMDSRIKASGNTIIEKPVVENTSIFDLDKIKLIESGGNGYNKDGSFIVNKAGAVGPYQIIPSMAKNPGYGIKGIDVMNTTEAEHRAYANDFLTKSLEYFKKTYPKKTNHEEMAIASYNYGIAATEKVLKKHGNLHWKGHLPEETRNYLKKYSN